MIKMIVTDLDDTLLHTDKSISECTRRILIKLREKHIKTVFATARGSSTKSLVPYELFDAYILMNGATAFVDGASVYEKTISPVIMQPFLRELSKLNIKAAAEIGNMHYANFDVQKKWDYIHNFVISDFSVLNGNADKLYALIEHSKQIGQITSILPKELYLHVSKDNLAMIMHKEATKTRAIFALAKKWDINKKDIAAFGDDINDKDMLIQCGLGIAMGNALDEVKDIADYICDTNDNDGLAKWLEEYML